MKFTQAILTALLCATAGEAQRGGRGGFQQQQGGGFQGGFQRPQQQQNSGGFQQQQQGGFRPQQGGGFQQQQQPQQGFQLQQQLLGGFRQQLGGFGGGPQQQQQRGPCPEGLPICADGQYPYFDATQMGPVCADFSSPLCIDGSAPVAGGGRGGKGGGGPRGPCSDGKPICTNGEEAYFDREQMAIACADFSAPLCSDGTIPEFLEGGRGGKGGDGPRGPCSDGKPICTNGEEAYFDREQMAIACADFSAPLCSDGTIPEFLEGGRGGKGGHHGGHGSGRNPLCSEGHPVCSNGEKPFFDMEQMARVCADFSTPTCPDGSIPVPPFTISGPVTTDPPVVSGPVFCADGSFPSCSDLNRPTLLETGEFVCSDGSLASCDLAVARRVQPFSSMPRATQATFYGR